VNCLWASYFCETRGYKLKWVWRNILETTACPTDEKPWDPRVKEKPAQWLRQSGTLPFTGILYPILPFFYAQNADALRGAQSLSTSPPALGRGTPHPLPPQHPSCSNSDWVQLPRLECSGPQGWGVDKGGKAPFAAGNLGGEGGQEAAGVAAAQARIVQGRCY